jgi:uncharacterized protein (DUF58 family)
VRAPAALRQAGPTGSDGGRLRVRAEGLAATLPALLVAAERVAATVAQGVHGRRRVGVGESFWQFRRYEAGDAATRIDWRQTAKSQAVFVRELEWEASQTVWLWRDASASMDWRSEASLPTKRERADLIVLALASLLTHAGERVGLVGATRPASSGRADLAAMATSLARGEGPAEPVPAGTLLPRHCELVLVGDFLAPLPETQRLVATEAARPVRGHIVQVLDPAEATLPFAGRIRFEEVETAGEDVLVPRVEGIRQAYLERLQSHQEGLAALVRNAGWTFAVHRTDRPPQAALLALHAALGEGVGPRGAGPRG